MTTVARATVNRHRRRGAAPSPPGAEVLRFHRALPGYHATPLHVLPELAGCPVRYKDESDRLGLPAFKILGASWAIERTLDTDSTVDTLIAASAGNHGRAVARVATQRRLACNVYLPEAVDVQRADAIRGEGAQVVRVDGDYDAAVAAARDAAARPRTALIADTGTARSASWVIDGYATLFREAAAQASAPFGLIVVPIGVGSLAASAVRFAERHGDGCSVIGVEPATAACVTASLEAGNLVTVATPGTSMTGMDCATPSDAAWPTLRDGLAGTVTVTDAESHHAMRELASHGVTAGDCGAATLAGLRVLWDDAGCRALRAVLPLARSTRVLCVGTEGATAPDAYRRAIG